MAAWSVWSEAPQELLETIAERLDSQIDVVRFRSVCTSWRRSSLPPSFHVPKILLYSDSILHVSELIIYRLEPPPSQQQGAFLVRVEEEAEISANDSNPFTKSQPVPPMLPKLPSKLVMSSPFKEFQIQPLAQALPEVFNLCDYRISELCRQNFAVRSFMKHKPSGKYRELISLPFFYKILFFSSSSSPSSSSGILNQSAVAIHRRHGRLVFWESLMDQNWIEIGDDHYTDLLNYKGRAYAVDARGKIIAIAPPSPSIIDIAPPICGVPGAPKYLVESCGDLLLVNRYKEHTVYKLNEEDGRWVEIQNLGEQMLFVGPYLSFSASASHFSGCKANSIYYYTENSIGRASVGRATSIDNAGVFDLENGEVRPLEFQPATWVNRG